MSTAEFAGELNHTCPGCRCVATGDMPKRIIKPGCGTASVCGPLPLGDIDGVLGTGLAEWLSERLNRGRRGCCCCMLLAAVVAVFTLLSSKMLKACSTAPVGALALSAASSATVSGTPGESAGATRTTEEPVTSGDGLSREMWVCLKTAPEGSTTGLLFNLSLHVCGEPTVFETWLSPRGLRAPVVAAMALSSQGGGCAAVIRARICDGNAPGGAKAHLT